MYKADSKRTLSKRRYIKEHILDTNVKPAGWPQQGKCCIKSLCYRETQCTRGVSQTVKENTTTRPSKKKKDKIKLLSGPRRHVG